MDIRRKPLVLHFFLHCTLDMAYSAILGLIALVCILCTECCYKCGATLFKDVSMTDFSVQYFCDTHVIEG